METSDPEKMSQGSWHCFFWSTDLSVMTVTAMLVLTHTGKQERGTP
jgi:hypothetical protein